MKILTTTILAATLSAGGASAAVLDFLAAATNNERAFHDGTTVTIDGLDVTLSAGLQSNYGADPAVTDDAYAYYDHGDAGLGVCRNVSDFTVSSTGKANRCDKVSGDPTSGAGDDNVTVSEYVTLAFDTLQNLSSFTFRNSNHNPITSTTETLLVGLNGGALTQYTFAALGGAFPSFFDVSEITLAYDNGASTANQFYLSSVTAEEDPNLNEVPLPAGLPLMLAGLAGLGVASRRRKG